MRKASLIGIVILALLSLSSVALAQDDMEMGMFCGDLSEADCDLLHEALNSLPSSTEFDLLVDINATAEGETVDMSVEAEGAYLLDEDSMGSFMDEFEQKSVLDVSIGDVYDAIFAAISTFNADLFITITPPEQAAGMLPMETINVDLWYVDGVAYADLSPLAMFDPSLDGTFGVDPSATLRLALEEVTVADIIEGADMPRGMDDMDGFDGDFGESFEDFQGELEDQFEEFAERFEGMMDFGEFATLERVDDTEMDDMTFATFEGSVDPVGILENELVRQALSEQMPSDMDADEVAEALADALEGSSLTVTYMVNEEDGFLWGSSTVLDLQIDPAPINELMGEETTDEPASVLLTIDFNRFSVNAVEDIAAPEDAIVIDPADLLGMIDSGGGF